MSSKRQSLTFCAAAIALLAMIPAACKRPAPAPSAPATIEFLTDSFDLDGIGWMSEQTDEIGVDLDVSGLCAIDKDVAFLFGGLHVPAGTIRSFLLRTADGGRTWHEVMPAVLGSEVTHVAFADDLHGWALALWTVEGPGTMLLSGSMDGGRTWRQLTEIQRSEGHAVPDGWPLTMTFVDASKGEIAIAYDAEESASVDDRSLVVETLVSDDGGSSWNMVRRETRAAPPEDAPPAKEPGCNATDWVLEVPSGDGQSITVRRFDRQRNRWLSMTLPRHFQYERGRVVSSR